MTTIVNLDRAREAVPNFDSVDNVVLSHLLEAAEASVKLITGKDWIATDYDELYTGLGDCTLFLRHYPILSIKRLCAYPQTVLTIQNISSATRATVRVTNTGLYLWSVTNGVEDDRTRLFADYPTLASLCTTINSIGGWTAVASGYESWPSVDLRATQGAFNAKTNAQLKIHTTDLDDYQVKEDVGELFRWGGWSKIPGLYRIVHTAGYETCPDDVVALICDLTSQAYMGLELNSNLASENLGQGYSYAMATQRGLQNLSPMSQQTIARRTSRRVPEWRTI